MVPGQNFTHITFIENGKRLVTVDFSGVATIWNPESGEQIVSFDRAQGTMAALTFASSEVPERPSGLNMGVRVVYSQPHDRLTVMSFDQQAQGAITTTFTGTRSDTLAPEPSRMKVVLAQLRAIFRGTEMRQLQPPSR
jgi:hypothetical protein